MLQTFKDDFNTTFDSFGDLVVHHQNQDSGSMWERAAVNTLQVEPLALTPLLPEESLPFAPGITQEALEDTAEKTGLVINLSGIRYPVRETAIKSLYDRAKISGTALPKLSKENLADILNKCLPVHDKAKALLLIREQKISAVHSGDEKDYSVLPITELLESIKDNLEDRFPGYEFDGAYTDHSFTSASWRFPGQRDALLRSYKKTLEGLGKKSLADKLVPGIRFCTSDVGLASAKVSALLYGLRVPIYIGNMLEVQHRGKTKVEDFTKILDQLFAQFGDTIAKLEKLTTIYLDNPVNVMKRICKKLSLPKKEALEAISNFEMINGEEPATAHDVFMELQEIMFNLKCAETPVSKMLFTEENLSRALSLNWSDFDLPGAVDY